MNQGVRFVSYNRMDKKRRVYQPRVFDGRIITFDEIERIHKEVLKFKRIEAISDPICEFIETCGRVGAQAAAEEHAIRNLLLLGTVTCLEMERESARLVRRSRRHRNRLSACGRALRP